jgi:hypothetical protein
MNAKEKAYAEGLDELSRASYEAAMARAEEEAATTGRYTLDDDPRETYPNHATADFAASLKVARDRRSVVIYRDGNPVGMRRY